MTTSWRGTAIVLGLIGLAALALAVTKTLDVWHVVVLAGVIVAAIVAGSHQQPAAEPTLPDLPYHAHAGARRDLSDLSWRAVDRDGRITSATARRILAAVADDTSPAAVRLRQRLANPPLPGPTTLLGLLDPLSTQISQETP